MVKKITVAIVAFVMIFAAAAPVAAAETTSPKEEVVYAELADGGSVDQMYVVNIFEGQRNILDYGDYQRVRNMTTEDKIKVDGDKITAKTNNDKLFYQGNVADGQLPWNIDISYKLDGKAVEGQDLAGKSGALEIHINISKNSRLSGNFFDEYALQVSAGLSTKLCQNIVAEGATEANAGGNKQLTYTILPGTEKKITITADVKKFEMESISINGIKMNMDLDIDSAEITNQFTKLSKATAQLDEGAKTLAANMKKVSKGTKQLTGGLDQLADKSHEAGKLSKASGQIKTGIGDLTGGLATLKQNINFAAYKAAMQANGLNVEQLQSDNQATITQLTALLNNENLSTEEAAAVQSAIGVLTRNNSVIWGMEGYLDGANDGVNQLYTGARTLQSNYGKFDSGVNSLVKGLSKMDTSQAKQLSKGMDALADGSSQLASGTGQLKDGTSGMDKEIENTIDELTGSGGDSGQYVESFTSEKNTKVEAVQFVIKNQPIEIPEETAPDEGEGPQLTFWQKFLNLFRQ